MENLLHDNYTINDKNHLCVGNVDAVELAKEYGTPLYVIDEQKMRSQMKMFGDLLNLHFPNGSKVCFASKALSYLDIYRIVNSEGLLTDVVSPGELFTVLKAGFPASNIVFHGNNKTDSDIDFALESKVGIIVCDNNEEIRVLNQKCEKLGITQKVMLRLSPGIDPHTNKKVITGSVDSKFGIAIETGQAMETAGLILSCKNLDLKGFHCHIGSQIFESESFENASETMLNFTADFYDKYKYECEYLNLGGGFGVRYVEADPQIDIGKVLLNIKNKMQFICDRRKIKLMKIIIEPGRSIVAAAGVTLYTVGSYKSITGYKNYISIDGGMPDNPRYALYQSKYTVLNASAAKNEKSITASIAGRCCESGDLIAEDIKIQPCQRGDILAVLVTGAYNFVMSSNYNRLPRPAMVCVNNRTHRLVIKRESFDDLIKNEL